MFMPLVPSKKIITQAMNENFAIGHFNIENLEIAQAVVEAAEEKNSPIMLAVTESAIRYAGLDYIVNIVKLAAKKAKVPVILHLDHGKSIEIIKQCIKADFTSIMIDASHLSIKENIKITKKVVKLCKKKRISVEAELGKLNPKNSKESPFTNAEDAKYFVEQTGIDSLAIAIGTSHGAYKFKGKTTIDFKRLLHIDDLVDIPLVLHGASEIPSNIIKKGIKYGAKWQGARGLDNKGLKKARKNGIDKVNIHTDLNLIRIAAFREYLTKNPKETDPRPVMLYAKKLVKDFVKKKLDILGSTNKA